MMSGRVGWMLFSGMRLESPGDRLFAEPWFSVGPLSCYNLHCHNMTRIVKQRRSPQISHWETATRRMLLISFVSM